MGVDYPTPIRASIVVMWMMPVLGGVFLFAANSDDAFYLATYGFSTHIASYVLAVWAGLVFTEWSWRYRSFLGSRRWPLFGLTGAVLTLIFSLCCSLAYAYAVVQPTYCDCQLVIDWKVARRDSNGNQTLLTLVLEGQGANGDYEFTRGHLNWSADANVAINRIQFRPLRFGFDNGQLARGSLANLNAVIQRTNLPTADANIVVGDAWNVLVAANQRNNVEAIHGSVTQLMSTPRMRDVYLLAARVWLLLWGFAVWLLCRKEGNRGRN